MSPVGRAAVYPPDIPFQAQQARGKRYNATIGQITDGMGRAIALPSLAASLGALSPADLSAALLYSPIGGIPELRELWHRWHRPQDAAPSSLPLVTVGLTHGLALAADLFGGPDRKVLVPAPFWGNYRQVFGLRTGADIVPVPAYRDRQWQPTALAEKLAELETGEPAVAILNLPSNPGGYSPTREERRVLIDSLVEASEARPLVVICDDAYSGLVYEPEIPRASVFWELLDRSESLIPIRLAGATKEFVFFGGRVGFLTLPYETASPVAQALDNKLRCLLRAGVGSPVALSQVILAQALRNDAIDQEVAATVELLAVRYRALKRALAETLAGSDTVFEVPFNSGAFAMLELASGLDPEAVRQTLLDDFDTGVISIPPRYLRLAFCSVEAEDIPELVRRVVRGVESLR
jgi:aspartate/methionine/tyrosine aminotransferase